ncbi:MAG: methyltransferase domain-containing protein [Lentisphaerae bacterium]|nr:methyltransferase domain-containing protein [Lentisphaerota bacterium]
MAIGGSMHTLKEGSADGAASHFDQVAASWEDDPSRAALRSAILGAMRRAAPLRPGERVLEYACGTGAIARALAGDVGSVVAMDASEGMVAEAARRAAAEKHANITVMRRDFLDGAGPGPGAFDRIVCAMALHHVGDISGLLKRFREMLNPGGLIVLADIEREDGSFHADMQVPHNGIDPSALADELRSTGFEHAKHLRVHEMRKNGRIYPVFLLHALKRRVRVMFLCTGNSCRSQMAEGWARALKGGSIEAVSAGIESHGLNPLAVRAMAEAGVDISGQKSKRVDDLAETDFDLVVTVCGHANETCPAWLRGKGRVIHAGFDDPPRLAAGARSEEEAMVHYRRVRDEIKSFVENIADVLHAVRD